MSDVRLKLREMSKEDLVDEAIRLKRELAKRQVLLSTYRGFFNTVYKAAYQIKDSEERIRK